MKSLEEYRDEEDDTYLSLRPRIMDLPWADFNVIPWVSVESIVFGEETLKETIEQRKDVRYQKGFAFEIEMVSSEVDEKKVGIIEGTFYNFDKMKAEGIPFRHEHYCANLNHVKILEILQRQDACFGEENSLNIFEIDKILIDQEWRGHVLGTTAMLTLAETIEYHFNQKVGILLVNPIFMLPEILGVDFPSTTMRKKPRDKK